METLQFLAWLSGQFLLTVTVMIAAFTLLLYNVRSNWPGWPRVLISMALLLVYGAWLLWDPDEFWIYRLGALCAALATYRFTRGFAKTFLPSFLVALRAATKDKRG
jgi:hypothetical protein